MNAPTRIQRRRTKGWRKPEGAVIVTRPSRFGNPFTIKDAVEAEWSNPRSAVTETYREWLRVGTSGGWFEETYRIGKQVFDRRRVLAELHTLRGKDLACTCPLPEPGQPDLCHAAVLLQLANAVPCGAQYAGVLPAGECIRAAGHSPVTDHADAQGRNWSDRLATYPPAVPAV